MLRNRLSTMRIMANDSIKNAVDVAAIIEYMVEKNHDDYTEDQDKITYWHHLQYCYKLEDDSPLDEILMALSFENALSSDPNATVQRLVDSIMKNNEVDRTTILQDVLDEDSEISVKDLDEIL